MATLEVAVKRKGEESFTPVETKRLSERMAAQMAKLLGKGDDA